MSSFLPHRNTSPTSWHWPSAPFVPSTRPSTRPNVAPTPMAGTKPSSTRWAVKREERVSSENAIAKQLCEISFIWWMEQSSFNIELAVLFTRMILNQVGRFAIHRMNAPENRWVNPPKIRVEIGVSSPNSPKSPFQRHQNFSFQSVFLFKIPNARQGKEPRIFLRGEE